MISSINKLLTAMLEGDLSSKRLPVELGEFEETFSLVTQLMTSMKSITQQANQISEGNYSADIQPRSDKDELGVAMQKMTATLRDVIMENKRQDWLKTGQNKLNDIMRGYQDETSLARNIITYLAKYMGAQIGALYLKEEDSEDLKLTGSYAFSKRKNLNERIQIGEGLVGQAAFEKELISVTNIPEDYTRIGSAIGDAVPRNIVVFPALFEGQLRAVIELGAFKEFSDAELEFLNSVSENIAIMFISTQANSKIKILLKETQAQGEELKTQQEELRTTNEELTEKTERMEVQSEELRLSNNELEDQKAVIEKKNRDVEIKAEELAISSKYKSEFLANMSHELRTPLNSMLLLSNNLAKNKEGNLTPEQVKFITIVHEGGGDLLNLINEILDLSKIEAGMMELELTPVSIQEVGDSLDRNFKYMMKEKGLDFKINITPNLPESISSDRKRMEQILKNLISNAIKFTREGSITVDFNKPSLEANLSRSGLEPAAVVAIAITDTGIGIPVDKQKVIFEAFQQAEGGTARKYGGTGLGLSISRELATLLGGEIQLQSQPDKGSIFTLYLPLDHQETTQKHRGTEAQMKGGTKAGGRFAQRQTAEGENKTPGLSKLEYQIEDAAFQKIQKYSDKKVKDLLVIEDDDASRTAIKKLIGNGDVKITEVANGHDAFQSLISGIFDCIILDLTLPDISGFELLEKLALEKNFQIPPVIIYTGKDLTREEQQQLLKYSDSIIIKGVGSQERLLDETTLFLHRVVEKLPQDKQKIIHNLYDLENVFKNKKVLVVDDDMRNVFAVTQLLEEKGVNVLIAEDGNVALDLLKQTPDVDLVLMDIMMPGMDGYETIRAIRKQQKFKKLPIIALTAKAMKNDSDKCIAAGANDYLAKPLEEQRLFSMMRIWLYK